MEKNILTDRATKELADLFKRFRIPFNGMDREAHWNSTWPKTNKFCFHVLRRAGYTFTQTMWIVYGIPKRAFKSEFEEVGGLKSRNCVAVAQVVSAYINKVFINNHTIEVAFDLSDFDAERVIAKFGLTYLGEVESYHSLMIRKTELTYQQFLYKVYTDAAGNWYSSYKPFGTSSHGFIFNNAETAFKFVRWMISQPDFFFKEIEFLSSEGANVQTRDAYLAEQEFLQNFVAEPAGTDNLPDPAPF